MDNKKLLSTYASFSGSDLLVSFENTVIGELQQISYAIQREKVPNFTCGSPNARSFSRNKRGIAGSLVLLNFDHDALHRVIKEVWDQIAPTNMFTAAGNVRVKTSESFENAYDLIQWSKTATEKNAVDISAASVGLSTVPAGFTNISSSSDFITYADMMPPLDVTLTFANEYGQSAFQKIYDLEILNEASGVSVDSNNIEKNYTWIARNISPLFQGVFNMSK